jgi:hypothetical protein
MLGACIEQGLYLYSPSVLSQRLYVETHIYDKPQGDEFYPPKKIIG